MKRSAKYELDMTQGSMLKKTFLFALPLMASSVLQLLFNAADMVVVGRYVGDTALAAVGSTGALINLIINLLVGLSVGGNVAVAHAYGAQDFKSVNRAVHTAMLLSLTGGILFGIVGFFLARPLLLLMATPENVIDQAAAYIHIYFAGLPLIMIYNFGSAILRAVGDTRRPLYFLTIAGVVNVLMNLFFVLVVHIGVAGVALATVLSQGIAASLVVICLMRSTNCCRLNLRDLRFHRRELLTIAKVGIPAGIQGSLFSISNMLIQSSINSFESKAMAGNTAAGNIEGFITTAMNAFHHAALTATSQNYGAGKFKRMGRVTWVCLGCCASIGILFGNLAYLCGPYLLRIYNTDPEVIRYGLIRMSIMCTTTFTCGMMDTIVGPLRGMGNAISPMIVSLTGVCVLRVIYIYTVFAANPTMEVLYISYPISWVVTFLAHLTCYFFTRRKIKAKLTAEGRLAD